MYSLFSMSCVLTAKQTADLATRNVGYDSSTHAMQRKLQGKTRQQNYTLNARLGITCIFWKKENKTEKLWFAQPGCKGVESHSERNERVKLPPARPGRENIYDSRRRSARIRRFLINARYMLR